MVVIVDDGEGSALGGGVEVGEVDGGEGAYTTIAEETGVPDSGTVDGGEAGGVMIGMENGCGVDAVSMANRVGSMACTLGI